MQRLELRLPPPAVLLLWAAAMKAGAWVWPALAFDLGGTKTLVALIDGDRVIEAAEQIGRAHV